MTAGDVAADNVPSTAVTDLPRNPTGIDVYRTPFSRFVRMVCWLTGNAIWFGTFRLRVLNPEMLDTPGGFQIACTHLSHLEPFLLGIYSRRPVDWLTRIEFYRFGWMTWFLNRFGAIPVRRQGVSASAIRTAIARVNAGRVVAIAPEGGVAKGAMSVCRGGPIRLGACMIACRTGKPIIPCIILGSHVLQAIKPWLPFRRAKLWIAFGEPLMPPMNIVNQKTARREMGQQLRQRYVNLYRQMLTEFQIEDNAFP
jgi:1-acyl-sn-glycerol-3-phosphate acyltransferase